MNEDRMTTWERLTAYFDGELSRDERLEMEQLLFENPEYAQALRDWKELRSELQAMPLHSLGDQRDAETRSRKVMDNIFETIAAGDVQWDSRPVDLDKYYKLQAGGSEHEPNESWSRDFRTLHPADRMRRWQWQLTALASVAALLLVSLFLKQNESNLMTGMANEEIAAEVPFSEDSADSNLDSAVAGRHELASDSAVDPAGALSEMNDEASSRPDGSLPPFAVESGLAMKSNSAMKFGSAQAATQTPTHAPSQAKGGGQFAAKGQAAPFQASPSLPMPSRPVPSQTLGTPSNLQLNNPQLSIPQGSGASANLVQSDADFPGSMLQETNGGAQPDLQTLEMQARNRIPEPKNVGIVLFLIDDPDASLAKLDSILVDNGFGNVQDLIDQNSAVASRQSSGRQSSGRGASDHIDPVVAGLVPENRMELPGILLTGRVATIVKTVNEFRDSGNSIAFMSSLSVFGDLSKESLATEDNPIGLQQSRILGQKLDILRNAVSEPVDESITVATDLNSLFEWDSKTKSDEKRKPFLLSQELGPAQRMAKSSEAEQRLPFEQAQLKHTQQSMDQASQLKKEAETQFQIDSVQQNTELPLDPAVPQIENTQDEPEVQVILLLQSRQAIK